MAIELPDRCPKGLPPERCQPLSQIHSDEPTPFGTNGFLCCGHVAKGARRVQQDRFRQCFRGATTDSAHDLDDRDVADLLAVLTGALSADQNRIYSGYPESFFNEPDQEEEEPMSDHGNLLEETRLLKTFVNQEFGAGTAPLDQDFRSTEAGQHAKATAEAELRRANEARRAAAVAAEGEDAPVLHDLQEGPDGGDQAPVIQGNTVIQDPPAEQ